MLQPRGHHLGQLLASIAAYLALDGFPVLPKLLSALFKVFHGALAHLERDEGVGSTVGPRLQYRAGELHAGDPDEAPQVYIVHQFVNRAYDDGRGDDRDVELEQLDIGGAIALLANELAYHAHVHAQGRDDVDRLVLRHGSDDKHRLGRRAYDIIGLLAPLVEDGLEHIAAVVGPGDMGTLLLAQAQLGDVLVELLTAEGVDIADPGALVLGGEDDAQGGHDDEKQHHEADDHIEYVAQPGVHTAEAVAQGDDVAQYAGDDQQAKPEYPEDKVFTIHE